LRPGKATRALWVGDDDGYSAAIPHQIPHFAFRLPRPHGDKLRPHQMPDAVRVLLTALLASRLFCRKREAHLAIALALALALVLAIAVALVNVADARVRVAG
jgi:hypothetical protein